MLEISPQSLSEFIAMHPGAVIVDVRFANEREEYGYVHGSQHVPLYTGDWDMNPAFSESLLAVAPPHTPVVFVCRSGNRSCVACELANELGYQHIYNLAGGHVALDGWVENAPELSAQWLHLPAQL